VQLIDPGPFGFRVIPNLSGKSGTGDRSRERNGTVVKRILTLPCPALHLPEVQHELLIHSIISGGTRVIFSATVSILCGNCWRVALVQVYFFCGISMPAAAVHV
jgi:hypothetical protein